MILYSVADWSDAYTNMAHIAGGACFPEIWAERAPAYRAAALAAGRARLDLAYGAGERERFDLFLPEGEARGLVVFVHGGYWMDFDKSWWSHLAAGCNGNGFAVAMPSYSLCPTVRIARISAQVAAAVDAAADLVAGPVHLAGHSAGGHLVTRLLATDSALSDATARRLGNVVSISGLHDLRPLLRTDMNATLHLDAREAAAESPALLAPRPGARLVCWVGGAERAEFRRQNALLANVWAGLGAATASHEEPDRHHFDVLDGLCDPGHPLTRTLLGG